MSGTYADDEPIDDEHADRVLVGGSSTNDGPTSPFTDDDKSASEVQPGTAGTVVSFDAALAAALAPALPGWRVITSETVASATKDGSLGTAWLPLFPGGPVPWVVVPPTDPTTDRDVYDVVSAWSKEADMFKVTDQRMFIIPGTDGLEWLKTRPKEVVLNAVTSAKPLKLGRRPAGAKKTASGRPRAPKEVKLDLTAAEVRGQSEGNYPDGTPMPSPLLMSGACPYVTLVETVSNDLIDDQQVVTRFRLAVALADGSHVDISVPVLSHDLAYVDKWLEKAKDSSACTVWVDPSPATGPQIAAALRASAADVPTVQVRLRSGWYEAEDGHVYYLTSTGGLGATGLSESCRAEIDFAYRLDFSKGLDGDPVDAWRQAIAIGDLFVDPTPYYAVLAFGAGVIAGVPPKGSLAILGSGAAGKTSMMRAALAVYGGINATWSGTDLSRGELLAGCHQAPGLVDDLPPKSSPREQIKQVNALDLLLRRGYDQTVTYGRLRPSDVSPSGTQRVPGDMSGPGVCISLEAIPDALADSARQRMLVWYVTKEDTWKEGAHDWAQANWVKTTKPLVAGAHLVMSLARMIEDNGGLQMWDRNMAGMTEFGTQAEELLKSCSPRLREGLYTYWAGWNVLRTVWADLGVPDDELEEWEDRMYTALKAWGAGVRSAIQTDDAGERAIEAIKAAIASGRAVLAGEDAYLPPGAVRVGEEKRDGVAIIPRVAADIVDMSIESVSAALRTLCGPSKSARVGGQVIRSFIVPADKWWGPEGKIAAPEVQF